MSKEVFNQYERKNISEMRPYLEGEDVSHVSISQADVDNGSPLVGDMIARNPKNHDDQWLVAKAYFEDNLALVGESENVNKEPSVFDFSMDMSEEKALEKNIKCNKQLRVDLDVQLQKLKGLSVSRERALSITKLQEGIMWLGMDLKRLNEPNPYPDSYNPENSDIAPTSDGMKM